MELSGHFPSNLTDGVPSNATVCLNLVIWRQSNVHRVCYPDFARRANGLISAYEIQQILLHVRELPGAGDTETR